MLTKHKPAALAACVALAAGGGATALAATAGASPSPANHAHGTGTVTVTGPSGKTQERTGAVSCKVVDGRYVVKTVSKRKHGRSVVRVVVPKYHGAGSYTAHAVFVRRHGAEFRGHDLRKLPVTITATGGSFSYQHTFSGKRDHALKGKHTSMRASWTCQA